MTIFRIACLIKILLLTCCVNHLSLPIVISFYIQSRTKQTEQNKTKQNKTKKKKQNNQLIKQTNKKISGEKEFDEIFLSLPLLCN